MAKTKHGTFKDQIKTADLRGLAHIAKQIKSEKLSDSAREELERSLSERRREIMLPLH